MTLIARIPGVTFTDNTLSKLYRDTVIGANTVFCYDFLDTYTWPSQADAPIGSVAKNLTPNGTDATFDGATFSFSNGLLLPSGGTARLLLPAAAKLDATNTGFVMTSWFKATQDTNVLSRVYGYHYNYSGPYGLVPDNTNGTNKYNIVTAGKLIPAYTISPLVVHQLAHALVYVSGAYKARTYLDNVLINEQAVAAPGMVPGSATNATIGKESSSGLGCSWVGKVYRAWLDTTPQITDVSAAALIAKDWNDNRTRFA